MKNLVLKSIIIFTILIFGQSVFAADNILNAVLLEKSDLGYNIVLRTDATGKISKKIKSENSIDLTLKNISADMNIPILYRNVSSDSSVVITDNGRGEVKLNITAPSILKSNVIFETPNSAPVKVNNNHSLYMILAAISALCALICANKISSKKINNSVGFDLNIRNREMKLLKKYREELTTIPSINYNMKNCTYTGFRRNLQTQKTRQYSQKV